ncbi:hypothetical protein H6G41_26720, partial [Tolypothrix sp. FACHB-123]|uniref:hypothetical protein n=1 Tax=Tolypothrix sp. FACHB-123 TaxID=2692868 RepID=UPI001686DEE6
DELTTNHHQLSPTFTNEQNEGQLSPTDELTTNHQLSPTDETLREITKGAKVRVHFPGSKRHGKTGVVIGFKKEEGLQKAIVKLENVEPNLRIWECFVPGQEGMRLVVCQAKITE